jgi:phage shock protein PspC (stress-responsive transcriptional regulator)
VDGTTASSTQLLRQINSEALLRFALQEQVFTAGEAMAATGLTRATVLGVCGGLGEYTGIDPTLWRAAFIALSVFNGMGLMIYAAMVALVPTPRREALPPGERALLTPDLDLRAAALMAWPNLPVSPGERRASRRRRLGALIALVGVAFLIVNLNLLALVRWDVVLPVAFILLGVILMLRQPR